MKWVTCVAIAFSSIVMMAGTANAGSDDAQWVAKCIEDNADAKVSVEVVTKYCNCMNDKMGDNEAQSITVWEKKHPKEEAECDKVSGWDR